MTKHHSPVNPHGYEPSLIKTRPLWLSAMGLGLLVLFAGGLMQLLMFALSEGRPRPGPLDVVESPEPLVPKTPLEPDQPSRRRAYEARQQQRLHSYGWIDQKQGLVHIPIDQAMRLVQEKYGKPE